MATHGSSGPGSVVDFPNLTLDPHAGLPPFLMAPPERMHAVQFYEKEEFLSRAVATFLSSGLAAGEHVYVLATEEHVDAFLRRIDARILTEARATHRLVILDARTTLSQLMAGEVPDERRFRELLDTQVAPTHEKVRVRAYGEMVDLLANDGNIRGAIRLEELWHEVTQETPFSLLCSYRIDNFHRQEDSKHLMDVCAAHSHVIPTESFVDLADPNERMREVALLQQRGRLLENLLEQVRLEQGMRRRAESSDAFKERFLRVLGHDLRNPLNTILTTLRMMTLRKELAPESRERLERVVASSVRMQRMIEQLMNGAKVQLPDSVPVERGEARDLVPFVHKVVREVGSASPSRTIVLSAISCVVRIDVERFEQVVWSLLSYVVAHSDPLREIHVDVRPEEGVAKISIASSGFFIDEAFLPHLFDSFHLETQPEVGMDGLTLGLYLAKRIITAHGGKVVARSSEETGAKLEAMLPLA